MTPADLLAIEKRRELAFAKLCGGRTPHFSAIAILCIEAEDIFAAVLNDSKALAVALREAWAREAPASLGEALNSGDGTYRP